jgi:uncharacterized protein (TIGR03435 family)
MTRSIDFSALVLVACLSCANGFAQTAPAAAPAFEAATVKPNVSGEQSSRTGIRPGGRFIATNVTLKGLIMNAYELKDFQVTGGPGWVESEHFDVNATANENVLPQQVLRMLQSLLAERFALKLRHTSRESDVLVLRLAKGGSKLQAAPADAASQGVQMELRHVYSNPVASMRMLSDALANIGQRMVVDKTGLDGRYSFDLKWGKAEGEEAGPSIFTAIEEQLGLHLSAEKQPVDIVVIESATKPAQ